VKEHWASFNWGDWFKDDAVASCSLQTQGAWINAIGRMYSNGTDRIAGTLLQCVGKLRAQTVEQVLQAAIELAATGTADVWIAGKPIVEWRQALAHNVLSEASVMANGWQNLGLVIVCRRRTKELKLRAVRSQAGTLGAYASHGKLPPKEIGKTLAVIPDSGYMVNGEMPEHPIKPPWTRDAFAAAAKSLSCPPSEADKCWAYYDSQGWLKSNGRKITGLDARSLLTTWLANPRRAETTKTEKELSTWEIKTRLDAIQQELNKPDLDSKKPDVAARRKLLFTEKSRLRQMQTGVTA